MPLRRPLHFLSLLLFLAACDGRLPSPSDGGAPHVGDAEAPPPLERDGGPIGGTCETGCTGFSYCDPFSGECRPGCGDDSACGAREYCDLVERQCACATGAHACGDACVDDTSPATCGTRCSPCPGVAHGAAACVAGGCAVTCDPGYEACGGACVACPTEGVAETSCRASRCVVEACADGYGPCASGCCAFTHAVAATMESANVYHVAAIMDGGRLEVVVSGDYSVDGWLRGTPSSLSPVSLAGLGYDFHGPAAVLPGGTLVGLGEGEGFEAGSSVPKLVTYHRTGTSWVRDELEYAGGDDYRNVRCQIAAGGGGVCLYADRYQVFAAAVAADGSVSHPAIPAGDPGSDWFGLERTITSERGNRDARLRIDSTGRLQLLATGSYDVVYRSNRAPDRAGDPLAHVIPASYGTLRAELVLGPGDEPHLIVGGYRMGHLHRVGGAWVSEALDLDRNNAQEIEAEADAAGHLHAALKAEGGLWYGHFDGTRWALSELDERDPFDVDLVLSGDRPVIVASFPDGSSPTATIETYTLP